MWSNPPQLTSLTVFQQSGASIYMALWPLQASVLRPLLYRALFQMGISGAGDLVGMDQFCKPNSVSQFILKAVAVLLSSLGRESQRQAAQKILEALKSIFTLGRVPQKIQTDREIIVSKAHKEIFIRVYCLLPSLIIQARVL